MFDGKLDVHGRQDREDVCLQEGHEDLEAGHHEHGGTGQRGGGRQDGEFVEQNCRPEVGHAEQQMSGDHVAQESQRQRDGANNEVRQELDRRDQEVHRNGQPRREELGCEEAAHSLLADARTDEGDVRDESEEHRNGNHRRGGDVDARDDARDVHGQDTEEEESDEAGELAARLRTQHVEGDVVADVAGDGLDGHLSAGRNQLGIARDEDENHAHEQTHNDAGKRQAVEFKECSLTEDHGREEVLKSRLVRVLRERRVGGQGNDDEEDREAHPIPARLRRGAASRRVIGH